MIEINESKCIKCFKCTAVCPFTVIKNIDGKPALVPGKKCLTCMHCAAACPCNAITFDGKPAVLSGGTPEFPETFTADLEKAFLARRSYRHFSEKKVPAEIIRNALETAAWAPSAKNQHPTKWIVIDNGNTVELIMNHILDYVRETGLSQEILTELEDGGNNVVLGTANTLILGYARRNAVNPDADTVIATYTVEMLLQSQGIGTCWGGYLTRHANCVPALKKLFNIPEDHEFYASLFVGYPENEEYLHIPERRKKADIRYL